jgi:glycosyltransferase involved in cell wall biosynthesis
MAMAHGDQRIQFCGRYAADQTGEILSSTDAVIISSLWDESSPLVMRDALACNVPVVASDVGGIAENIKDGTNGFLFKTGNSHHLSEVLQMIIDDPEVLNEVKRNISSTMIPTVEQEAYIYERTYRENLNEFNN